MSINNYVEPFNPDLPQTSSDVSEKNNLNSYFPIRTNESEFDWNSIIGLVLQKLLRKKVENYSYEQFIKDCEDTFKVKLSDKEFWVVLREMYFDNEDIFSISPELLLFRAQKGQYSTVDSRMATMFTNLLANMNITNFKAELNFIEYEILDILRGKMVEDKLEIVNENPYLPYLSKSFREDLRFMSNNPKYFLTEIEQFLSFYAFTYTAQLSLALPDWRSGNEPQAKPLYFIMDHERASKERTYIKKYGFSLLKKSIPHIFPMLAMLENLQPKIGSAKAEKVPLWEIANRIQESKYEHLKTKLKNFALAFRSKRGLQTELKESDLALDWLENIMKLSIAQFKVGGKKGLDDKYASSVDKLIVSRFTKKRGSSGRILVLNQDYTILLTNLVIGNNEKLRFHELITKFQQRGIFVDKQTEQELIKFYERIGNVERMSDSGDAVYVRKTI